MFTGDRQAFLKDLEQALYASKIISYAQGFVLLQEAAKEYNWNLNYGGIALLWRGGCIIRSVFLAKIKEAFDQNPRLSNLLLDPFFRERIQRSQQAWRRVVSDSRPATASGSRPCRRPCAISTDSEMPAFRPTCCRRSATYFGAHQYERIDRPRGQFFHTNWTGHGGETASSSYTV